MFPENLLFRSNKQEDIFDMNPEYPYIIREVHPVLGRPVIAPWHWHEELELVYVQQGTLSYQTPQNNVSVESGNGLFLNSNVLHQVFAADSTSQTVYTVHMFRKSFLAEENSLFDQKYIRPLLNSHASYLKLTNTVTKHGLILKQLLLLAKMNQRKSFGYEMKSRNIMSNIWLILLENQKQFLASSYDSSSPKEARLQKMLLYMQEYYAESLSLKDISTAANISERECLRCFQEVLHTTPFLYLQEYRIQAASNMLVNTSDKITDIAVKCGFSSASYFGKVFRRKMRCTPCEYREVQKNGKNV